MRYCTGVSFQCQHWGVIPNEFKDLKHSLLCPICKTYMGPVGRSNPVKEAGYSEKNQVTPELRFEPTP